MSNFAPDTDTGWVLDSVDRTPFAEVVCNKNNANHLQQYSAPMPEADKPDF